MISHHDMAHARTDMAMAYSYLDYKLNLNIFTATAN